MTRTIAARFDGAAIIPDEPVELPMDKRLTVKIEWADEAAPQFVEFLDFAAELPGVPSDLSSQHDHYLYGSPKR